MEQVRIILKENLQGKDLIIIAGKLGYSIETLKSYLNGLGTNTDTFNKILDASYDYFVGKYKTLLTELEISKTKI